MTQIKRKSHRTTATKTNNNSPRRGNKLKQRKRNSNVDSIQNNVLIDMPEVSQKPNGPRTRSNTVSTRKQLFRTTKKFQTNSDESETSKRNSDLDTTDEETKLQRDSVGRIDDHEDSEEIIFVGSGNSKESDENEKEVDTEDSDNNIDFASIINSFSKKYDSLEDEEDTDEIHAKQLKLNKQTRQQK